MAVKKSKVVKKSPLKKKSVAVKRSPATKKKPIKVKKAVNKPLPKKKVTTAAAAKVVKAPVIVVKKAHAAAGHKPTIRTGPSIAPRSFGKAPLSAHSRNPIAPVKLEKAKPLTKKDIEQHKDLLLKLRDRVIDEISFLANDNLNKSAKDNSGDLSSYSFHMADQGTDNFDREFAASLLNNEHDVLYEIEEALRRIEQGTYGICEMSGLPIERERLKALPFARYSMAVQSEMERGKPRFRPFRRTSIQSAEASN
jgi:RNA polymerase-binding transcription factor DksA